jgi:endonuclease III
MATKNRAALIGKVLKVVRKHYKPAAAPKERTLLEHLLYACCLENSPYEAAERAFQVLTTDYFDWNEVRVSTIRELSEALKPLNDPAGSATRLKRILQSVFETHYSFDLEPLKKQNIGQAVKQFEKYNGSTPFIVAYVTQQALGGHSIPISQGLLEALRVVGVASDAEAAKGVVPGLERAVPKSKGAEVGSLLHQLGVEMHRSPYGPTIRKILLEIDPACKDRLPKRSTKSPTEEAAEAQTANGAVAPPAIVPPARASEQAAKKPLTKRPAAAATDSGPKSPAAKPAAAKRPQKNVVQKKIKAGASASGKKKTTSTKRLTKRKPR